MKNYVLYVDDTGFNANQKNSSVLKQEHGSCAGVLVPKDIETDLILTMIGLNSFLNKCYGTSEFHFTDIYNRNGNFKSIKIDETLEILDMFADLFQRLDLKVFVHTNNASFEAEQQPLTSQLDKTAKHFHLPEGAKSQELLLVYLKAKQDVEQTLCDGKITEIISDEGLRKNNATEKIDEDTVLQFQSSKDCVLLQLADYAAWFVTRSKHILDKASTNKTLSEIDKSVLKIYSRLSDNYVNLSKHTVQLDNLENFDYDQIHRTLTNKEKL